MENTAEVNVTLAAELEKNAAEAHKRIVRIIQIKALIDSNKPLYEELDKLVMELNGLTGPAVMQINLTDEQRMYMSNGEVKFIAPEQVVTVVDNFANTNVVFRPAAVKRFEVEAIPLEEYRAREARATKKANAKK